MDYTEYLIALIKDGLRWDSKRVVLLEGDNPLNQFNLQMLIEHALGWLVRSEDTPELSP